MEEMRKRIAALPKLQPGDLLDEEELLSSSSFPIHPDEIIAKTQAILACNNGKRAPLTYLSSSQAHVHRTQLCM